jgi:hypothetical protein
MKKLLLASLVMFCAGLLNAQSIDILVDGAAFSMTSPNGVYIAGNMEDAAVYYNTDTKKITVLEGAVQDDGGCFVWAMNDKGQLAVDWKMQAAIWSETDKFEILPQPEGLTIKEQAYSAARCISNDGKYVVVSFGSPTTAIYLYTQEEGGIYSFEKLPLPEVDPIYNQIPQFIAPCGITEDGKRVLLRYVVETAEFELPFMLESTPAGDWSTRWIAAESIVEGGKTDAVFYGTEFVFDGDPLEDPEGYEAAYNEWLALRDDYYATIDAVSTGYFFKGTMGDLSDLRMSANGKYAKMNISYKDLTSTEEDIYEENYPAVIDLETEQLYVFTCLEDAGCLSVTNDGVVSLATPKVEYFRYGHISSIADPTKSQTLTEWTKEKTNGAIDMAKYMTYTDDNGNSMVAEGAAVLSADGSRYMTNQYNGFGGNQAYETYLVQFSGKTAVDVVYDNSVVVYPNPTNGMLNFSEELSNIEVFDIVGRCVYTSSAVESSINLEGVTAGTYFLVADAKDSRVSVKFVVK